MKVFIAGATGALGLPLVRALVQRHYEVIGMTRSPEKRPLLEQLGVQAVVADALDAEGLARVVREAAPTHIVHLLTALPKNGPLRAADLVMTNELRITGTANLLRAAVAAKAKRIVGESYVTVYGYGNHSTEPLTEDSPLRAEEDATLQPSVAAMRSLEEQLLSASRQGLIEAVILRYGMTYGPENAGTLYMLKMLRQRWLPLVSGADGLSSWIHNDDAVAATIAALECGRPGAIYNIVDDEPVGFNEYVLAMAQAIGAPRPFAVPRWLMRLVLPFATAVTTARLPVSNAKAKRDLDWRPQFPDYREGLRQIARQIQTGL